MRLGVLTSSINATSLQQTLLRLIIAESKHILEHPCTTIHQFSVCQLHFNHAVPFYTSSRIIKDVEIIFSTIFWAVPLFMRLEPVTNSGPTMVSIGYAAACAKGV